MNPPQASPDNLRVPAEWERLRCVWLAWPHNLETWPGHFGPIPAFYLDWIRRITESTPVQVIASGEVSKNCRRLLDGIPYVEVVDIPTNDVWIRDYGPTFVHNRRDDSIHAIDWRYNAWGGKYPPWDSDDAVAGRIGSHLKMPTIRSRLCVEGGAMEFDGRGRLLTTPDCLLSKTRNPGLDKDAISRELHQRLGVTEIVWLDGGGLVGDDTDGHIDQLARFIDPKNVVAAVCDDRDDPNHVGLEENYRQLRLWGSATKPQVEVHRLPIPPARQIDGQRVPESYCNFLRLGESRMLVPTFGADTDDRAIGLLREISSADVEGIDCRDIILGLGALHCASRDEPAVD